MNYYYDVVLNFQDDYCMFYEWDKEDTIEYIKKIPLFHIHSKDFIDIYTKRIRVNKDFLEKIENKTILKQSVLKYTCIISDGKNSIALEFDDDGKTINKSSLLLEDELNINEFMYNIEISNIDYEIIGIESFNKETRQELKIKKILRIEILKMYNNKELSKLKYIYLEWFNKIDSNYKKMYEDMLKKIKEKLTAKEYEIYELIKITYNV